MHSPNTQSGGQASYVEIEKFLSEGANGPEHQALRHLIETSAEIRDQLKSYIGIDDQLLVIEMSGDATEWAGVNDAGSQWLKDNI
jgi:hypothetical protein